MKAFQQKSQSLFDAQTARFASLADVRELSFGQCSLAPELLQTKFPQLANLTRITLVDMKPPLNDASFAAILAALPESAKQNTLRAIDVCDNKISTFPTSTSTFPKLVRLLMANNKVENVDNIFGVNVLVRNFPALRTLDVESEFFPASQERKAFEVCPSLVVVNGKDKNGEHFHDESDNDQDDDAFDGDGDDEGEGNGDVDAFVDEDGDDDAEEFNNNIQKESPARRDREE